MSSKNNCSLHIYVFSQKGGGFSLKNLVIAVAVTQNALYSCFALFLADLYSVDAFCCMQEVVFLFLTHI
jgi:hypothetical protein